MKKNDLKTSLDTYGRLHLKDYPADEVEKCKIGKCYKTLATRLADLYKVVDSTNIGVESRFESISRSMIKQAVDSSTIFLPIVTPLMSSSCVGEEDLFGGSSSKPTDFSFSKYALNYYRESSVFFKKDWKPKEDNQVLKKNLDLTLPVYSLDTIVLGALFTPLVNAIPKPWNGTSGLIELPKKGSTVTPGDIFDFDYHLCSINANCPKIMYVTTVRIKVVIRNNVFTGETGISFEVQESRDITLEATERQQSLDPIINQEEDIDYEIDRDERER